MSNNSIIKDLVFPISLLLDTPKVKSQFKQLNFKANLRGFNLYEVLEEGMKANYMQCLSSSDITVNNVEYPAGTPITDIITSSASGGSVWLNDDGTTATSTSTNIKYDRGNVTVGTGGLSNDYFSVIPKSTFIQDNILNATDTNTVLKSRPVFTLPNAIDSSVGNKTVYGTNVDLSFDDTSQIEHTHLSIVGRNDIIRWLSPSPVRYLGNASHIVYRGKDIGSTKNSNLINNGGIVTLHCPANSTQSSSTVQARIFFINSSALAASNTIQNITSVHNSLVSNLINLTNGNNTVNITTLENFSNSRNFVLNASSSGSSINITNLYGLRLISPTSFVNTNITNNYGISQEWSSAKNYFAGFTQFNNNVGIGASDTSGYKLYVAGDTWLRGGNNYIDGATILRGSNAIEIARFHSNLNFGIGTNTPTTKLHLVGNARLESYASSTYDSATPTKLLGINSTGEVVSATSISLPINGDATEVAYFNAVGVLSHTPNFTANSTTVTLNSGGPQVPLILSRASEGQLYQATASSLIHEAILLNGNPEGIFSAEPSSVAYDGVNGHMYIKQPAATSSTGWHKVYVENYNMSFNAEVFQASHGFTALMPIFYDYGNSQYKEANGSSSFSAATTIFIAEKDVDTMVVAANGILQAPDHQLTIGVNYCLNPNGSGIVEESRLVAGDNKQYILFVLDQDQIQLNLQPLYVLI